METKSTSVRKTIFIDCDRHKCVPLFFTPYSVRVPPAYAQVLNSHKNSWKHARRNVKAQVFEIRVIKLGSAVRTALENVCLCF